jgi:prepilin peptidase CpaA
LVVAVVWDLRAWRIPNAVTFPAALAGIVYHAAVGGVSGLQMSSLGLLVGLGILFIPFVLGGMGGGDVKLLAALGAWLGPKGILFAALYSGLAGGVLALVAMMASGEGVFTSMRGIYEDLVYFATFRERPEGPFRAKKKIPYSVAIAVGTLG